MAPAAARRPARRRRSKTFGANRALDDLRPVGARAAQITVLLGPERRRQDHRDPHDHRRLRPRRGHRAHVRARPGRRRRGGPPPLRRGVGQAGALRPPRRACDNLALLRRALRPRPADVDDRIARGGRPLRHRRGPRPAGRRLLDRHEDPAGPGPLGAARPRAAALRRADLRPRPRVVARRARADPRDDRRRPHRRDVHPPARSRPRASPTRSSCSRTAPTSSTGSPDELTRRYWPDDAGAPRRRGPRRARPPRSTRDGVVGLRARPTRRGRACSLDGPDRVPDLVARARRRRRCGSPGSSPTSPTLEDLYFAVRADRRATAGWAPSTGAPSDGRRATVDRRAGVRTAALGPRLDRRPHRPQAAHPGQGLLDPDADPRRRSSSCSCPPSCCFTITQHRQRRRRQPAVRRRSRSCPQQAQAAIQGDTEQARAGYALAVYLFAPVAVVVPLTISTAVGAADHRRRARAGHRRVPRPLPRRRPRDLPRQAHRQPDPRLRHDDRRLRHLLADRQPDRRARRRRLVLPDRASGGC